MSNLFLYTCMLHGVILSLQFSSEYSWISTQYHVIMSINMYVFYMPKNQETYLVIHGKNIIEKIDYINCEKCVCGFC